VGWILVSGNQEESKLIDLVHIIGGAQNLDRENLHRALGACALAGSRRASSNTAVNKTVRDFIFNPPCVTAKRLYSPPGCLTMHGL